MKLWLHKKQIFESYIDISLCFYRILQILGSWKVTKLSTLWILL